MQRLKLGLEFTFAIKGLLWPIGHRHLAESKDLRLWVQSLATHASNFSTPDCKKNQQGTLSQGSSNLQ